MRGSWTLWVPMTMDHVLQGIFYSLLFLAIALALSSPKAIFKLPNIGRFAIEVVSIAEKKGVGFAGASVLALGLSFVSLLTSTVVFLKVVLFE
jgi:hypothetical protein